MYLLQTARRCGVLLPSVSGLKVWVHSGKLAAVMLPPSKEPALTTGMRMSNNSGRTLGLSPFVGP
jgi:hypothetical protein